MSCRLKKFFTITTALLSLLLAGCSTMKDKYLLPGKESVNPRLEHLAISPETLKVTGGINYKTDQDYMRELFASELPNICSLQGEPKGEIELQIKFSEHEMGMFGIIFSYSTGFFFNIFGVPVYATNTELKINTVIRDSSGEVVWERLYEVHNKVRSFLYSKRAIPKDPKELAKTDKLLAFRKYLVMLKADLQNESAAINSRL